MRCRKCDYRLWNLRARTCPECGETFAPSAYEFVPNSVAFCCPHCDQAYYGTDARGHLTPIEFDCVRCGAHVHMDEMVLRPTASVSEERTRPDANPWLERTRIGWLRAFFATIGRGMVGPARLMKVTPENSSVGEAFAFALWVTVLAYLFTGLGIGAIFTVAMATGSASWSELRLAAMFFAIPALVTLAYLGVWGLVTHVLMRIGAVSAAGLGRTYQALCYSAGANVFSAVPCLNFYVSWIGWVWWVVSAAIMLKEGQKVSGLRATLAVLVLPVAITIGAVGVVSYAIYAGVAAAQASVQSMQTYQIAALAQSLNHVAQLNGGQPPAHAIELVTGGHAQISLFVTASSYAQAPVGSTTLSGFNMLSQADQLRVAQAAAAALPSDVIAHRLGDFAFVYHGIDFNTADPALWTVILSPSPGRQAGTPPRYVDIGCADGSTLRIETRHFANELAAQNLLRASHHLQPLPDPSHVTHTGWRAPTSSPNP